MEQGRKDYLPSDSDLKPVRNQVSRFEVVARSQAQGQSLKFTLQLIFEHSSVWSPLSSTPWGAELSLVISELTEKVKGQEPKVGHTR